MRLTAFVTAALSSAVALLGFAGAAQASATIDLIWIDVTNVDSDGNPICLEPAERNCPQLGTTISSLAVADDITLGVIITAGPGSILAAGVDVDYNDALPELSVSGFRNLTTAPYLPTTLSEANNDTNGWVQVINAASFPISDPPVGIGLPAGATAYLGTVTFHKDFLVNGQFEIAVGVDGPDGVSDVLSLDGSEIIISDSTTFNSAFLTGHCILQIEINSLRTGGKTVRAGANQPVNVTAKARILKGTAVPGTVIDTTLTIQAFDGTDFIDGNSAGPIQLEIGKGGKGAKLPLDIPQCTTGFIDFVAEFLGFDADGSLCKETRILRTKCR